MRISIIMGWILVVTALIVMVAGHFGDHTLSWTSSQISTYAATAPYDYFITGSMLLSALSLLIIGLLVSKYQIIGTGCAAHFVPALSGAAASGLLMLAYYEETAPNLNLLQRSGFLAIRTQSFHDAGLTIFFYSTVLLIMVTGFIILLYNSKTMVRILGGIILGLGPAAYLFMTTTWPKLIGFEGNTTGINQRAALFSLWLAVALILALASNKVLQPTEKNGG